MTGEEKLWEVWKRLWRELEDTEVEYDEATGCILVEFAKLTANAAISRTLDQALNSGDGSYRP